MSNTDKTPIEFQKCDKCGKPFLTEGGSGNNICTCESQAFGWICPKCGASNSPYTSTCPTCSPPPQITC